MKKTCIDCRKEKNLDEFHERPNYNKTKTTYYRPMCKTCSINRTKDWINKNRKKYLEYQNLRSHTKKIIEKQKHEQK